MFLCAVKKENKLTAAFTALAGPNPATSVASSAGA